MTNLNLPSGRVFDEVDLETVQQMHDAGTVRWSEKPFSLKAGGASHVYFFGREDFTLSPGLLENIALSGLIRLYDAAEDKDKPLCLIGVPVAGSAIAAWMVAAQHLKHHWGPEKSVFLMMRSVKKTHGAHNTWVDGKPPDGSRLVLVENVRTTGASEEEALKRLAEDGIPTADVVRLAIVDRKLRPETPTMKTVYYMADIITAFGHLGLWPQGRVDACLPEFLQTS